MEIKSILTHPGGSHKDEFLACCVVLAKKAVAIERREPTDEDLADASICVLDVGHEHNPDKNNFDHHQFPADQIPTCSLSLILQHLELYKDARQFCDWLEPAEWFDCRGPNDTAKWLNVKREAIGQLNSPIDISLLRRFAKETLVTEDSPLWQMMKMIGEDLLSYITTLRERINFVKENSEFWPITINNETHYFIYLPRTEPLPEDASGGVSQFIEESGKENVIGIICPDRRGQGYGLSKFNDSPLLDFTKIEAFDDVHFAHKRGFIAKTSATEKSRLEALINAAIA